MQKVTAIIMAAGKGTRMESEKTKVLHEVGGKPMLAGVIDSCFEAGIRDIVVIVGENRGEVGPFLRSYYPGKSIRTALQAKQLGTAHAIMSALKLKHDFGKIAVILSGDVPMILPDTVRQLINEFTKEKCGGIICTSKVGNPSGYGRIVTDAQGDIIRIVEEKNASDAQKKIGTVNGGVYAFDTALLKKYIKQVRMNPVKKEYYLTDLAEIMAKKGIKIRAKTVDYAEVAGINDRVQLQEANAMKNKKTLEKLCKNGITIADFNTVFIDENVVIGKDTVINPCTVIRGKTRIGKGCIVGPFAHVRPDTVIGDNCKIGNYVEIKKSVIGDNVNVAHLSYIGDTRIGSGTNIGAGTITCNYDGKKKNRTIIGRNVFVGSDTKFVAPVAVGDNAVIAAGSVITGDVPGGALAIARARQVNKEKWTTKRRAE